MAFSDAALYSIYSTVMGLLLTAQTQGVESKTSSLEVSKKFRYVLKLLNAYKS